MYTDFYYINDNDNILSDISFFFLYIFSLYFIVYLNLIIILPDFVPQCELILEFWWISIWSIEWWTFFFNI